ncbi:hypothetical protein GmHk_01G002066 [Glycine max]|nr:hypothetical protein GmHk_01G002066 [Glycine max]
MDLNGKVITNDDNKEIPDAVNTLIFTIAQHFIGDPSLWKDRSTKLLSNLKCRTSADFRWYRDTFLNRVYTKEDSQQPFCKEKFLAGLPRSLGDKVRNKIRSQPANEDIPYESLSYGQLISYVQKSVQNKRKNKILEKNPMKIKLSTKRDFQEGDTQHKPSTSKEMETPKPKLKSKITCYNRGKQGHISKYCRLKRKLRNLNLEPAIEEQINNLLIETLEEETNTSSSILSDENLNIIQQDDQLPSTDDDNERQINTLTREQYLLFEAINSILDPRKRSNIFKRLENASAKPTTIQDLQTEINNLKREVKELRSSDSENTKKDEENEIENLEDEMFMGLINKIKIQKFYINIRIIINDFILDTMVLFDTGADSNCILEGLIHTKFFEKTSEKLSTVNGSKLKINYKLSNAIIENQGLRINTNFLLVKNLKNEVILETPFIRAININLIGNKINLINFLKEEAVETSLRGGQSSGKGFKLALLEPTTKKASSVSFGSPTQAGSSTQKTKIEGSSTQIIFVKPESSTQESPKSATAKQTSANYTLSIQTLQAL